MKSITIATFTESQILSILAKYPGVSLGDISKHLKAGISTTRNLTFALLNAGKIRRIDKGKPKKPVYEYYLAKIEETKQG